MSGHSIYNRNAADYARHSPAQHQWAGQLIEKFAVISATANPVPELPSLRTVRA